MVTPIISLAAAAGGLLAAPLAQTVNFAAIINNIIVQIRTIINPLALLAILYIIAASSFGHVLPEWAPRKGGVMHILFGVILAALASNLVIFASSLGSGAAG